MDGTLDTRACKMCFGNGCSWASAKPPKPNFQSPFLFLLNDIFMQNPAKPINNTFDSPESWLSFDFIQVLMRPLEVPLSQCATKRFARPFRERHPWNESHLRKAPLVSRVPLQVAPESKKNSLILFYSLFISLLFFIILYMILFYLRSFPRSAFAKKNGAVLRKCYGLLWDLQSLRSEARPASPRSCASRGLTQSVSQQLKIRRKMTSLRIHTRIHCLLDAEKSKELGKTCLVHQDWKLRDATVMVSQLPQDVKCWHVMYLV